MDKRKNPDFAASSVCDRIAFAYSSSRNRTAHVPSREKLGIYRFHFRAVRSLQSGLSTNNRAIRALFAYFSRANENPLQFGLYGGESGIRTHVTLSSKHAFQACAFSHSAISPACWEKYSATGRLLHRPSRLRFPSARRHLILWFAAHKRKSIAHRVQEPRNLQEHGQRGEPLELENSG